MEAILENDQQKANLSGARAESSRFVWYELQTPDAAAAAAFYAPVLGWKILDPTGMPDHKHMMVCVGETPVGALLEKSAGSASGGGAHWMGYIGVSDIRLCTRLAEEKGGAVRRAPEEIPGVGTFAAVADPQGAVFALFQPPAGMTRPEQPSFSTPGMPVWHDLAATDWEPEFQFYSELFGWTKAFAIDMGPNSIYQVFAAGSEPTGGMMTMPGPAHGAFWLYYFHVEDIDAAIDRVKQNGGTLTHGPSVVPGDQWMAHCRDAQGALFGMVGSRRK